MDVNQISVNIEKGTNGYVVDIVENNSKNSVTFVTLDEAIKVAQDHLSKFESSDKEVVDNSSSDKVGEDKVDSEAE